MRSPALRRISSAEFPVSMISPFSANRLKMAMNGIILAAGAASEACFVLVGARIKGEMKLVMLRHFSRISVSNPPFIVTCLVATDSRLTDNG